MISRKIYGVGETIYDILFRNGNPLKAVPGGSAFNALITLGRCRLSPVLSTFVGDDPIGRLTLDFMQRNGVDTGYVEIRKNSKSHLSLAFLNEVNDAEYVFYKDHASLSVELTLPAFLPGDYLLFGSFFAINPVIRPQMLRYLSAAVHAGATLYYDINFRPSHLKDLPAVKEHVLENIRLSSVVRGSMEDFHCLFGVDNDCPDRYALAADIYHRHLKGECPYLLVTDGARAVHVLTPVRHLVFEVAPISTVSTVGAGDNFNAGIVYFMSRQGITKADLVELSEEVWAQMVHTAQRFSACVCQSLDNYVNEKFVVTLRGRDATV